MSDRATANSRQVQTLLRGRPASDGAGVKLTRVIGTPELSELDPFLLLDEFRSDDADDYIAGFPDHPHRGFETVTYMLAGRMRHADNQGNSGLLRAGSAQWMTAGRGIVHSEMPEQEDGLMWGFQLWINLPASDKMTAPRYQDIEPEAIPVAELPGGARVKVIAGQLETAAGPVEGPVSGIVTEPLYLDVALPPGGRFRQPLASTHAAFVYVFEGTAEISAQPVARGEIAALGPGEDVEIAAGDLPARLLLIAGKRLGEPIARHGPFVMNSQAEIMQAIQDYQAGRF